MARDPQDEDLLSVLDLIEITDTDVAQTTPLRGDAELTLRDEANAITAHAFRNGFLEDLHAGCWSLALADPGVSRITDDETKKLMIESSARLAHWLYLRELLLDERPDVYIQLVESTRFRFTRRWERRARTCEVPGGPATVLARCSGCGSALLDGWRFCPMCGNGIGGH